MNFEMTEEQKLLQQTARDFAEKEIAPIAAKLDRDEKFPVEQLKKLSELGLCGITISEQYGGGGMGNLELAIVLEEINRACASTGVTLSVHCSLLGSPITKFGTEEQKKKYLPRLASGELLGAYALTEPDAGSDASNQKTTAKKTGDHYLLNGTKIFVTSGDHAGVMIVYARTSNEHRTRGISAFLVEPSFPGFKLGTKEKKMGIRGSSTMEIILQDCKVPASNLLGQEGQGFHIALDTLDGGRIGIASQAIGIARASLEDSIKYAKERLQFGQPLAAFQAIQWKLADMAAEIDAARFLVHRAAWLRDQGKPCSKESAMGKLFAAKVANRAAQEAVQIHGGAGYTTEFAVERYMRDARITELYEGTSEVQRLVIAKALLG